MKKTLFCAFVLLLLCLLTPCALAGTVSLPDSLTAIEAEAFANDASITEVTIPSGVTSIGAGAFRNCSSLKYAVIPSSVQSIGSGAFAGCSQLTAIVVPGSKPHEYCLNNEIDYLYETYTFYFDYYTLSDGTIGISRCDSSVVNAVIPKTISGKRVTRIDSDAFYGCYNLQSVIIPDGVTSIGLNSFESCEQLEYVSFPESLESIESNAFIGCFSLKSVCIPQNVSSIGVGAFADCSSLTEITVSPANSYYSSSDNILMNKSQTTLLCCPGGKADPVQIPDTVTTISSDAFYGCSNLTSLNIPDSVTTIGSSAFNSCSRLTSLVVPESVSSIGYYAFSYCPNLKVVVVSGSKAHEYCINNSIPYLITSSPSDFTYSILSDGTLGISRCDSSVVNAIIPQSISGRRVTRIDSDAFYGCYNLQSVVIPDGVTSIGLNSFESCEQLEYVSFPESLESIESNAFIGCFSLKSVYIPQNVSSIGVGAFADCSSLEEITVSPANNYYCSLDGILMNKSQTTLLCCPGGKADPVQIPDTVITISSDAFYGCYRLTSLTIPDGVKTIGSSAFNSCSRLTSLVVPESVSSIGYYAFSYCPNLKVVVDSGSKAHEYCINNSIPYLITSSPSDFAYSLLSDGTLEITGYEGDADYVDIPAYINGRKVTVIGKGAFFGQTMTCIAIPETVRSIPCTFHMCGYLREFKVAASNPYFCSVDGLLMSKDRTVLQHCPDSLARHITIPESVRYIADYAFNECSITSITIPGNVISIGYGAFDYCNNLTKVNIEYGVRTIDSYAFRDCENLISVVIPNSVNTIGEYAFLTYSDLTAIVNSGYYPHSYCEAMDIPYILADIETPESYFSYSVLSDGSAQINSYSGSHSTLVIPDTINGRKVTAIGEEAFYGCTSLKKVVIPDGVTSIGMSAFSDCTNLECIFIPDSVESIGGWAFFNCSSLKGISLPEGMAIISRSTFMLCTSLTSLSIPTSVILIEDYAFRYCSELMEVVLPDSILGVGSGVFEYCTDLYSVSLPESLSYFGEWVFDNCPDITAYVVGGSKAHEYCIDNNIPYYIVK